MSIRDQLNIKNETIEQKDKQRLEWLRLQINSHNISYYVHNESVISDQEYDKLFKELLELENKYPEQVTSDSPTQRVGSDLNTFKTIEHKTPMLSLGNTYSKEELIAFDKRVRKTLGHSNYNYVVELKIDGASISLTYENGILKHACTRGDGEKGDDVTANIRTIKSVPLSVSDKSNFEVRGEVYMSISGFEKLNKERKSNGEQEFANPRNSASGSLKLLDPKEAAKRPLDIFCYYYIGEGQSEEQILNLNDLNDLGFKVNQYYKKCFDIKEVIDYCDKIQLLRNTLDYCIDGIVVKVNEYNNQRILGCTSHDPRWAIAYKFPAEQAITALKSITIQVGRTGKLTPVAELEPVKLAGSTISRATLHNFDFIQDKKVIIGEKVIIEKGGDVIPKVVRNYDKDVSIYKLMTHIENEIRPLFEKCPVCGHKTIQIVEQIDYICPNHTGCPAQVQGSIEHFVSKGAMDIDGCGPAVIKQLLEKGLIKNYADLYHLYFDDLTSLDRIGLKSSLKLLKAIEKSKYQDLYRLIYALGIKEVGEETSKILANKYESIVNLMNADLIDLLKIDGIGEVTANYIHDFFNESNNITILNSLAYANVNMKLLPKMIKNGNYLANKTFVFTGTLEKYKRSQAGELVKSLGGNVASSISKKVTHVVVGKDAGSKLAKAQKLSLDILTEEEFDLLLK